MTFRNRFLKYGLGSAVVLASAPAMAVTDWDGIVTAALAQTSSAISTGMTVAAVAIAFLVGYKLIKRVVKGF